MACTHERWKQKHKRLTRVITCRNAPSEGLPASSCSCAVVCAHQAPLTEAALKSFAQRPDLGSLPGAGARWPFLSIAQPSSPDILPGCPDMYHVSPGNSSCSLLIKEMDNHLIAVVVVSHLTHVGRDFPPAAAVWQKALLLGEVTLPLALVTSQPVLKKNISCTRPHRLPPWHTQLKHLKNIAHHWLKRAATSASEWLTSTLSFWTYPAYIRTAKASECREFRISGLLVWQSWILEVVIVETVKW